MKVLKGISLKPDTLCQVTLPCSILAAHQRRNCRLPALSAEKAAPEGMGFSAPSKYEFEPPVQNSSWRSLGTDDIELRLSFTLPTGTATKAQRAQVACISFIPHLYRVPAHRPILQVDATVRVRLRGGDWGTPGAE